MPGAAGGQEVSFRAAVSQALADLRAWKKTTASDGSQKWESAASLMLADFGPVEWTVRGLLVRRSLVVVAADPKASKTWALIEIALAQATATKAFGRYDVAEGATMLFLNEDSRRSIRNRTRSLLAGRGVSSEVAAAACEKVFFRIRQQLDLCNPSDVATIIASVRCAPMPISTLALDPLRNLHDKDEDKSGEMREVMQSLRAIRDLTQCTVVFAHHNSKPPSNGDKRAAAHRMRGSSAIHGAVDGLIVMSDTDAGANYVKNTVTVSLKDARGAGMFELALDIRDDDGGEAVDASWSVSEASQGDDKARARPRATPQQELDAEAKIVSFLAQSNKRFRTAGQPVLNYSKRQLEANVRDKLGRGLRTEVFNALVDSMCDRGKLIVISTGKYALYNVPTARLDVIPGGDGQND